jgi:lysozyme
MKLSFNKLIAAGLSTVLAVVGFNIAQHEGEEFTGYLDPVGVQTTCYGHTETAVVGKEYTEDECVALLSQDINTHDEQMMSAITVELSPGEHSAYLSFHYNVGTGNFKGSTLLRYLNKSMRVEACNELSRWVYAKGRKLQGLVERREQEREMCLDGVAGIVGNSNVQHSF